MCDSHALPPRPHRRELLSASVMGGLAAMLATAGTRSAWAAQSAAEKLSPRESLEQLYAGNRRFVAGQTLEPNRDIQRLRELAPRQSPFAAFLGCADSRVPIEIVFDQGFGDLFVTRIAGNVAMTENIASLEFATQVLAAKVLYVLGHTSCGAVAAAAKATPCRGRSRLCFSTSGRRFVPPKAIRLRRFARM